MYNADPLRPMRDKAIGRMGFAAGYRAALDTVYGSEQVDLEVQKAILKSEGRFQRLKVLFRRQE